MTVSRIALALLAGLTLPGAAVAEVLSTSDPTIENSLCVGRDCGDPAAFAVTHDEIVLSANNIRLRFEDTSDPAGNSASDDWALMGGLSMPLGSRRRAEPAHRVACARSHRGHVRPVHVRPVRLHGRAGLP